MDAASPTRTLPRLDLPRLLGVLPDAVCAAACLWLWLYPFAFGRHGIETVMLTMLVEFLLVHGTGLFSAISFQDEVRPGRRALGMLGLGLVYGIFLLAFAFAFHAWWPFLVFGWLIAGKLLWMRTNPHAGDDEKFRQMATWAFSVAAYLGAVFAALLLPLPRLGLDAATVAALDLPGGGEWVERPHTAVASLLLYYAALATFKWFKGRPPARS